MTEILPLLLAFLCGIVFNIFWGYFLGLGFGVVAFRASMVDTLFILSKNIQSVYEIQQLKYMSYEVLERDEKFIQFQKHVDERETESLKNTVIRNYINSVPAKYSSLVEFHDWDSAMKFFNTAIKERQ
jgi:phosphoribosylformylglycinamidine (FGAM) synthase PurS component